MPHFTPEFIDYFRRLDRNNRREWFHANKTIYERAVKDPFHAFVEEMIHRIGAVDAGVLHLTAKDCVFRLARDIRFAKDKTPYKTFMTAVIAPGGRKQMRAPGLYFRFGTGGVGIASGMYELDREELFKVRTAIHRDGATLARLLRAKAFRELFGGEFRGERNKRLPKEFAADVERFPFIANKQFYFYAEYDDPKVVLRADLPAFLMRHYRAGAKVNAFLQEAVR